MSLNPLTLRLRPVASRHASSAARAFSSTPTQQKKPSQPQSGSYENVVPPESPRYIRFHQPPQHEEVKLPRVRGRLPKPREIFTKEEGQRKIAEAFLRDTVPKGKNRPAVNAVQVEKKRMADYRRRNLESGIKALWKRKTTKDAKRTQETARKMEANMAARDAPERTSDLFTRGTVHNSILDTSVKPDPDRFVEADRSRTRVALKAIAKRDARRDALMELYVNARSFIVTEAELKAEVDTIFSEDYFRKQNQLMSRYGAPDNVWGVHGNPPGVRQMLSAQSAGQGAAALGPEGSSTGPGSPLMGETSPAHQRAAQRQKKIAEEFTGGKMES